MLEVIQNKVFVNGRQTSNYEEIGAAFLDAVEETSQPTKEEIENIICEYYNVTSQEIREKKKGRLNVKRNSSDARKLIAYFFNKKLKLNKKSIAKELKQKEITVYVNLTQISLNKCDETLSKDIENVNRLLMLNRFR